MPNNNDSASNQKHPFHFSQLFALLPFLANHSSNKIKIYRERKNKKGQKMEKYPPFVYNGLRSIQRLCVKKTV